MITLERIRRLTYIIGFINIAAYLVAIVLVYIGLANDSISLNAFMIFATLFAMFCAKILPQTMAQINAPEAHISLGNWFFQLGFLVGNMGILWLFIVEVAPKLHSS